MKHKASLVLASLAMVFSCGLIGGVHANKEVVEPAEAAEGNYYSSITDSMSGTTLLSNLKSIINTSSVSVSYDWSRYEDADEDPNNSNNVLLIYARKSVAKSAHVSGSTGWNREHTFPQSKMEVTQAKSDNHIIFASDNKVNGARSSLKMGVVSGGTVVNDYNGNATTCRKTSSLFDPNNQARGVVARTTMYAAAMYDFDPTDNFESIATMLRWHLDYPVDSFDQGRNEKVYTNQHNRNPFVDHPEYACRIWGSTNSTTQSICGSTAGITSISKTSASLAAGDTTTINAVSSNSGTISWSSSNTSIATVSNATAASGSNVTITGVAQGSATITASITISGTTYTKTCSVTVTAAKSLSSIAVSNAKTSYVVDDTFVKPTVTATFSDSSTDDVKDSAVFSGYNLSQAGNQTVNVSYTYKGVERTTSYQITVSESGGSGESGDFSETYNVSNQGTGTGKTWTLSDYSDETSYLKCPNSGTESIAYIPGIFTDKTITSSVVITIHSATFGSGSNPTSSTFSIYNSSACTSQVTASQTGTLPSSSTYKDVIYTVSQANASSFNDDLAIKIVKPGKQIRLQTISVEFSYETSSGSSDPILSTISISTAPTKTTYSVGEYFDPTGLVITRTYSDSSSDTYTYAGHTSDFTFVPSTITPLTSEDDSIEVIYGGQSCFFEIELTAAKELSSISISGYTTAFVEGDTFAFGGTVTAHYADTSTENVTSSATFSGYDMTTVGNQTVTVTYQGESLTYQIVVSAGTLNSITVSGQTITYTRNASFSFDGTCTATFANGYQKEVSPTSVTSPDMSTAGSKTVTVSYTYNGNTRQTTYQITVNSYRTVMEESYSAIGTITYTNDTEEISVATLSTTSSGGYSAIDKQYHAWRLGAGSKTGTLTVTSTTANIRKIVVNAKYYSSDSGTTFTIDGTSKTLTNSYADYEKEFSTAKSSVALSSVANGKRVLIASVTVYSYSSQDIGQSEDCVGLETFINTYMHMDYTENLGYCGDSEHHYYSTAKEAFNALNSHQRSLFTGNSAYSVEWTRLSTWASKNGDSLNNSNQLAAGANQNPVSIIVGNSGNIVAIITLVALISAASIGGYFFIKKRKEI